MSTQPKNPDAPAVEELTSSELDAAAGGYITYKLKNLKIDAPETSDHITMSSEEHQLAVEGEKLLRKRPGRSKFTDAVTSCRI